jgi:hypothetical protein
MYSISKNHCLPIHIIKYLTLPSYLSLLYCVLHYVSVCDTSCAASFGQGAYMDFSLERPETPHPVLSKYDKKLRANSKSELPQKKKDRDQDKDKEKDKDKEESQLRLSSLTTDLTSCRGIGAFQFPPLYLLTSSRSISFLFTLFHSFLLSFLRSFLSTFIHSFFHLLLLHHLFLLLLSITFSTTNLLINPLTLSLSSILSPHHSHPSSHCITLIHPLTASLSSILLPHHS